MRRDKAKFSMLEKKDTVVTNFAISQKLYRLVAAINSSLLKGRVKLHSFIQMFDDQPCHI